MLKPAVVFNPKAQFQLQSGFFELARLLSLTLGPTQGAVLFDSETKAHPEMLSDAATIARRIIALPDRCEDVGGMLLRQAVWRTRQRVGDGTAVTAVLAQAILKEASRVVAAGANAMLVQRGVRRAIALVREELLAQAKPANSVEQLTAVAQAVTNERELALVLGELFDLLGADAHITIEDYVAPLVERAYLDGGMWAGKLISPYLQTTKISKKGIHTNCRVALYSERLHDAEDVEPLLSLLNERGEKKLLLVAVEIKGEALETLVLNHTSEASPLSIAAVALPAGGGRGREDLDDLAALTGATVLGSHIGKRLRHVEATHLGSAGRVEAGADMLMVMQGGGSRTERQNAITQIKSQLDGIKVMDETHGRLLQRLGRLTGNAAILKIGASTKSERAVRHQKAEQGIKALAATVRHGTVLGGGVALFRCKPALKELLSQLSGDEQMGGTAVYHALDAHARQIVQNGGVPSPESLLARLAEMADGTVYDVTSNQFCDAEEAGILDPVQVLLAALESAASGAMLALSVDAVVLHKKPEMSYEP